MAMGFCFWLIQWFDDVSKGEALTLRFNSKCTGIAGLAIRHDSNCAGALGKIVRQPENHLSKGKSINSSDIFRRHVISLIAAIKKIYYNG